MFSPLPNFSASPGAYFFNPTQNSTNQADKLDKFEYLIIQKLNDPEKAAAIRKAYEMSLPTLVKVWSGFGSIDFQNWLIEESKLIGSLSVDHIDLAMRSFPTQLLNSFRQVAGYADRVNALKQLEVALQNAWGKAQKETMPMPPNNTMIHPLLLAMLVRRTVVVLYRKCGNGHVTAAEGIKQLLEKKGYKVHLINGGDVEHNRIYAARFNKYNGGSAYCKTEMNDLRNRIKPLHPDLIINTVAHHNHWSQVAYDLDVPELVVHTDYEVHDAVAVNDGVCRLPYVYDNSSLIQYCIPHEDNDANRAKIKNSLSPARYQELVKEMGFPVREPFQRETDPVQIEKLRNELGFHKEEHALLILGHREPDTTTMIDMINQLRSSKRSFSAPICIVAVCGNDPAARIKLAMALKKMPSHPDIRVKIEGYLDEEKMAKYMKVASRVAPQPGLMVSKRGGSTTAEATEMGVYTISLPTLAQEECNGRYTERHGLGERYDQVSFVDQVSRAINWKGSPQSVYKSPFDWKGNLLRIVHTKITASVMARLGMFQFTTGNKA